MKDNITVILLLVLFQKVEAAAVCKAAPFFSVKSCCVVSCQRQVGMHIHIDFTRRQKW